MAIQSSQTRFGFTFSEAYSRIVSYSGDKLSTTFLVRTFSQASAAKDGSEPIREDHFQGSYEEDALIPALYKFLKEQPQFAEAKDV